MIEVEQAIELLLKNCHPKIETELCLISSANKRIVAKDIVAKVSNPPFNRSPLDGYAFNSVDSKGAAEGKGIELEVIARIYAGDDVRDLRVKRGQAVRIMTGATIPNGCDCVIRQEDTDYAQELGRERSQDFGSECSQELGRERSQDFGPECSQDFGQERSQDFGQECSQDFEQERSQDFGPECSQELGRERSQDFGQERSQDSLTHFKMHFNALKHITLPLFVFLFFMFLSVVRLAHIGTLKPRKAVNLFVQSKCGFAN